MQYKSRHILILFFFLSLCAQGQRLRSNVKKNTQVKNYQTIDQKAIHFGFGMGLNSLDFVVYNNSDVMAQDSLFAGVSTLQPGFHVNIVTNYRLADNLAIRFLPGLIFGQRNLVYWYSNGEKEEMKIESNLLDFPLLLKYRSKRINNYRPYIIAGGNVRVDMAARKDYDENEEVFVKLKRWDYYAEVGFGIDFYLEYFKFTTELKYSVGFNNVITDTPYKREPQYVNVIDRLNSSVFQFTLFFE